MTIDRRNVVVGIEYIECRVNQLLRCTFETVVNPGDNVFFLQVSPSSGRMSKGKPLLDSYLKEYKSLCSQNQVDLKAEILVGSSYRKVLVREASKRSASAVIVGLSKESAIRGWASVAVYCIKRLPQTTDITVIYDGKIVYRRCSGVDSQGLKMILEPETSSVNSFENEVVTGFEFAVHCEEKVTFISKVTFDLDETEGSKISGYNSDGKADKSSVLGRSKRRSMTCISLSPQEDLSQQVPGWPLLRTASLAPRRTSEDARKMSVVQWAMSLPRRSMSMAFPANGSDHESWECRYETMKTSEQKMNDDFKLALMKKGLYCKVFTYRALKKATSCFSTGNLIAKGGCNSVYKGVLHDGKKIAVKVRLSSKEAQKDFIREVDIMTAVKHIRITPILGICIDGDHLISVYDFLPRGNLEQILQEGNDQDRTCSLPSWKARFKIAHGIAQAIHYLHKASPKCIIHRDIKSSNILLNDELEPQLSDFGLAIWGSESSAFFMDNDVAGTFGYLAPEYLMYGEVSEKIDVYSYGVVLLELLSGKKPISCNPARSRESLVMWAKPKLGSADIKSILDPRLDCKVDDDQVQNLCLAAKLCLVQAARLRPRMNQILRVLEGNNTQVEVENITCMDEVYPDSSAESHISVAFEDSESCVSSSSPVCVEEYLKSRWSRSSSLEK